MSTAAAYPAWFVLARAMTEAQLTSLVVDACTTLRLQRYHTHRSDRSPAGWPDEVLLGPGGVLFRELKRHGKNPTRAQQAWLDGLAGHGLDVAVWRPEDWYTGRIMAELQAIARAA